MTPRKAFLLALVGSWIVRLLSATLRFRVDDQAGILSRGSAPVIWLFWHNRLFIFPHLFGSIVPHRRGAALTSASKDGEILAAFLRRFRIQPVRGSSSRRGAVAMLELIRCLRAGSDIGITPDGPRGPRYQLNPGSVLLAQKSGVPVLPVRVHYSSAWQLKSWDAFQIPKPFSKVDVTLLPLETVAATPTKELFEQERARLERVLQEDQTST